MQMNEQETADLNAQVAAKCFGIGAARTDFSDPNSLWILKDFHGNPVSDSPKSSVEAAWFFGCPRYTSPDSPDALKVLKWCAEKIGYMPPLIKVENGWAHTGFPATTILSQEQEPKTFEVCICDFALQLAKLSKEGV